MLCRLCLEDSSHYDNIIDEVLNIVNNIFTFQEAMRGDDPICNQCLNAINTFYIFYKKVEHAQKSVTSKSSSMINCYLDTSVIEKEIEIDKLIDNSVKVENLELDTEEPITPCSNSITVTEQNILELYNYDNKTKPNVLTKKEERNLRRKSRSKFLNNEDIDKKLASFMTLSCDICSIILPNLATLKDHFKKEHNTVGYVVCCNKKFIQNHFLIGHIEQHLNPATFKCLQCNKILSTQKNYDKHMSTKHFHKQWFQCEQCPRKFECETLLARHAPIHYPKNEWTFSCAYCKRRYPSEHFLRAHVIDVHEKKNICPFCGKSFSARKFKQHQQTHNENPDQSTIQCEICGAKLKTTNSYRSHMNSHKDAETIHKCSVCGKISPNRSALKVHLKNHEAIKIHKCNICEKAFKRALSLRQHMATHTGEYLYQCAYCMKTFIYDSAFHTHKKKEHPIEYEQEKDKIKRTDFKKFANTPDEQILSNVPQKEKDL